VTSPAASESGCTKAAPRSASLDVDLLLLLLLVVAFNLPQLSSRVVPINDTFYNFANFQIFYSELFFHGDLARWLPYASYGIPSDYEQIISLAPTNYFFGLIGWRLGVTDTLLLFKLAVVLEQLVFVFGVFLVSRLLFRSRATTLVLGVAAAGTTVWYAQQWWDLRIYYLLPLLLYFWFSFLEARRPELLWRAGLVGLAWSVGNLAYLIPLWGLVLLVIAAATIRDLRGTLASLLTQSRANLLSFALFVTAASVYAYFVLHAFDLTVVHASSRDPLTGEVSAEVFRGYGGKANLVIVLNALLFGWPVHLPWGSRADNSLYLGLVPLVGFGIALVRERSRTFFALAAAALVLVWLSFGGAFATLAYHLPGLSYYRHIGLVFGLVKVLLLIASGYGIERLWSLARPRLSHPLLLLFVVALVVELSAALPGLAGLTPKRWTVVWGDHVLVRLGLYALLVAWCRFAKWSMLAAALGIGLIADLALYQYAVWERVPLLTREEGALQSAAQLSEPFYQPERREHVLDPARSDARLAVTDRSAQALAFATRPAMKETYAYAYQFANFDPCREQLRSDTHLIGVDRLLALERSGAGPIGAVVGCGTPKLRLASSARVVRSDEEARAVMAASLRAHDALPTVIEVAPEDLAPESAASVTPGSVEVTHFTLSELVAKVDVVAPQGAWLVYADAYHPRWRASVNGAETEIHPADLAFKALRLPPGASEVRLWFDPPASRILGLAIALGGVTGTGVVLGWMTISLFRGHRVVAGR